MFCFSLSTLPTPPTGPLSSVTHCSSHSFHLFFFTRIWLIFQLIRINGGFLVNRMLGWSHVRTKYLAIRNKNPPSFLSFFVCFTFGEKKKIHSYKKLLDGGLRLSGTDCCLFWFTWKTVLFSIFYVCFSLSHPILFSLSLSHYSTLKTVAKL